MKVKILVVLISLMLPLQGLAAIQFDFMSEPWGLSDTSKEQLIEKLKEIDFKKIEGELREAGESLPDDVKNLPERAGSKLAEEGIDAGGIFSEIWNTFSSLGKWMLNFFLNLFD